MKFTKWFLCLGLVSILSGCGSEVDVDNDSKLHHLANPMIKKGYKGWAKCTGEPHLNVRSTPHVYGPRKTTCKYNQLVWVAGTYLDQTSGRHFAELRHYEYASRLGYADRRWLTPSRIY